VDDVKDGLEVDVDCGAACEARCAEGKACIDDDDCRDLDLPRLGLRTQHSRQGMPCSTSRAR
jgi:hypothetical protein